MPLTFFMLKSKKIKRSLWNYGLGESDMLNLYPRIIGAVSGIDTGIVSVRYRYIGLVQISGYHSFWLNSLDCLQEQKCWCIYWKCGARLTPYWFQWVWNACVWNVICCFLVWFVRGDWEMYHYIQMLLRKWMTRNQKVYQSFASMQDQLVILPDSSIIVVSQISLFSVFWAPTMTSNLLEYCYLLLTTYLLYRWGTGLIFHSKLVLKSISFCASYWISCACYCISFVKCFYKLTCRKRFEGSMFVEIDMIPKSDMTGLMNSPTDQV